MATHGLGADSRVEAEESTEAGGYAAATSLLDVPPGNRPTAIFAGSDAMAVGVLGKRGSCSAPWMRLAIPFSSR